VLFRSALRAEGKGVRPLLDPVLSSATPSVEKRGLTPLPSDTSSIARFGFLLFLGSESMLFAGLLGALVVFRVGAEHWPPIGLPRLPVEVTALNTLVLFSSCWPMRAGHVALRGGDLDRFTSGLLLATLGGIGFLAVQGTEWVRLVHAGLVASSGPYGATFFALIGCHGLHVSFGVAWLCWLVIGARRGRFTAARHLAVELGAIYWYYVSLVWAVVFPLVYLGLR